MDEEKDEEKERLGPVKRRKAQSETVRKQLEGKLAELQLVLAHTKEAFQQLANCAGNAYQTVTLGLVIAKAENDPSKLQTQRVNWDEVAQRIFATVTQLGVLQCSMEPKLNFLQTGNRMKSVYDVLTQLYLAPSETLQGNFPCSPNSSKESIKPSRPVMETITTLDDDGMEKLIKKERHTEEEKIGKQETSLPDNEIKKMRSWADSAKGKNEGRSEKKSTVVIVPKEEKSPPSKNKLAKKRRPYGKKRKRIAKKRSKKRRKMSHAY